MAITVYPRLGELLRERKMSVAELARQIEARWGRSVDPKTLYRLTSDEPIKRVEIGLIAQIAAVLELGMGELFSVLGLTLDVEFYEEFDDPQTRGQYLRMRELFGLRSGRNLSRAERKELDNLLTLHRQREHERNIHLIAAKHGVSYEQAEADVAASLEEALEWWRVNEKHVRREFADGTLIGEHESQSEA